MSSAPHPLDQTMYQDPDISKAYVYRQDYSEAVFTKIRNYMARGQQSVTRCKLAVDVCCGTGASTRPLAQFCDKVIGLDISESQLAMASRDLPNVEYKMASAYEMTSFLEPGSVDLVTVGIAIHFLDVDRFFHQVKQVLKPGGTVVVHTYTENLKMYPRKAQDLVLELTKLTEDQEEPFLRMFLNDFKGFQIPMPGAIRDDELVLQKTCTIPDVIGYLRSVAENWIYHKQHPHLDIFGEMARKLTRVCSEEKSRDPGYDGKIQVTWPFIMFVGYSDPTPSGAQSA